MTDARDRRVSVVTGGASGIGAAIVEVLAARGDRVVLLDVGASSPPPGVTAMTADVGDEAMVEAAFQHVRAELGRVDVLVNCAGIGTPVSLVDTTLETWSRTLRVNATGVFLCSRAAARLMLEQGDGCIVSISSTNATLGIANTAAYAASKGAVEAFTRAAAAELGPFGVRVNAVAPGAVDTPMWRGNLTGATLDAMRARTALGRLATPADVAAAVAYLTSPAAGAVSGVVLSVCAGRSTTESIRVPD